MTERPRTLYVLPRCPFGHRAAFALAAKELPFELALFSPKDPPPELVAAGPRAKSPTLFDGDAVVHDSLVVLEYLEDRYPERPLLPGDPAARAAVRMTITRVVDELAPRFGALTMATLFSASPSPETIAEKRQAILDALGPWDALLAGRPFLAGERFTLADVVLYTPFPGAQHLAGLEVPEDRPHLSAWLARVAALPGAAVPGVPA
ncbi:MAG: glutathione S-transferase family protein [Sandaracinaceae bacterium]|nr:glutathione S-transferase family protein [Sandaracinaceae bacterium]